VGALLGPLWLRHLAFTIGTFLLAGLWLRIVDASVSRISWVLPLMVLTSIADC
jgi:hypothetical protein